jgi:DNA-binding MarR family transcriptional regulator
MNSLADLDPVIHAPNRLAICALLMPLEEAEFQILRDELGVSDSVLSKHISKLEQAGHLRVHKRSTNGRQRTWVSLTNQGRKLFAEHVTALRQLLDIG